MTVLKVQEKDLTCECIGIDDCSRTDNLQRDIKDCYHGKPFDESNLKPGCGVKCHKKKFAYNAKIDSVHYLSEISEF